MLCFAEKIYLIALDENTGKVDPQVRETSLETVLIGAVLGELTFHNKISIDKENIDILDTTPAKSPILNEILTILNDSHKQNTQTDIVLRAMIPHARRLEELILSSLMQKGILKENNKKILWILTDKRYPVIDNREIISIKKRIRKLILSGDTPDQREIFLISLLDASDLLSKVLSADELSCYSKHIAKIAKECPISEKINYMIYNISDFSEQQSTCISEEDTFE